jgi:hypothetical protein
MKASGSGKKSKKKTSGKKSTAKKKAAVKTAKKAVKKITKKVMKQKAPAGKKSKAIKAPPRKKAKKTTAGKSRAALVRTPAGTDDAAAVIRTRAEAMDAVFDLFKKEVLGELKGLRAMMERTAAPSPSSDAVLETGVDSLRRLLSDLMEQRMENHMAGLVDLRFAAVSMDRDDAATLVAHIDRLLYDMGAIKFEADRMDYVDPLIHEIVAEHHDDDLPDGVIVETLLPGFRTARGAIVSKAHVAVNRRI